LLLATFRLPGGVLSTDGTRQRTGTLRPLNGYDEEWASTLPSSTSRAAFVTGLLERCVKQVGDQPTTRSLVRDLTVGDRDYLVLKIHEATFGEKLSLLLVCPREGCGAKMDLDLAVADIPVEEREVRPSYRLALEGMAEVEFRLPRGGDQEALAEAGDAGDLRERLLDACLLSGTRAPGSSEAFGEAIEQLAPRVESELEVACPECGQRFEAELDVVSLLLQELARGRAGFDREIHLLALHYHWPLRELLSLTRPRRRRFLRLLVDELGARAG
jgi:hypothetical protein